MVTSSELSVALVRTPATPTAVVAETTTWEAFPSRWRALLDEVWEHVRSSGLDAGRNVMLYRNDRPQVEVGVEMPGPFEPRGRVVASSLPAGLAATTIQRGPPSPEGLGEAHEAVRAWCAANGHELEGPRWEVYGHWPEDGDASAYEVEIFWLVHEEPRSGSRPGAGSP
jgi:effector-binding domain-containing protein